MARRSVLVVSVLFALAACSGGNAPIVPSNALAPTITKPSVNPVVTTKARVSVTIQWKATSPNVAEAACRCRPHFVSPSAQSVAIDVSPVDQPSKITTKIIDKPSKNAHRSTAVFDGPAGEDDFVFGVFDHSGAKGNEIGGAEVVQRIIADKVNPVHATLDGYVGKAVLSSTSPFLVSKPDGTGHFNYTMVGPGPLTIALAFEDLDGNLIVPPGAMPVTQVTSSNPSMLVTPVDAEKHIYALQMVAPNSGVVYVAGEPQPDPIALEVTASSGFDGGQQYETAFVVQQETIIYAASGSGASAAITGFDQAGNTYVSKGAFRGLSDPLALAWDRDDRMLIVADAGHGGKLLAFDGTGALEKGWIPPNVGGVTSVTYNPDTKNVYVTTATAKGGAANAVLAFDHHGKPVALTGFAGLSNPIAIGYDADAALKGIGTNEFYVIDGSSPSATQILAFRSNGNPGAVPAYSLGAFVPTVFAAYVENQYGVAAMGGILLGQLNGSPAYAFYSDAQGSPSFYSYAVPPGITIDQPVAMVLNPLASYTGSGASGGGVTGPQPVQLYVANGNGDITLVAIDGFFTKQDPTAKFPKPPRGAAHFSAIAVTF